MSTGSTTTRTLYIGNFYEETLTGGSNPPYIVYYILGSKMVGMRRANQPGVNTNGQFRVVGDQLGSTTLIIDTASVPNVTQREYYKPFGEVAFTSGSSRTDKGFTGQRLDSGSGLMYYGARYYDPVLSYFISPDTIVPGSAVSSGGGADTLGVDDRSKLISLTTDFHETAFLGEAQKENLQNTEKGFWFQLSKDDKKKVREPWGPQNPQALNRYSYVLNNPLKYIDPTGYRTIRVAAAFLASFVAHFNARVQEAINWSTVGYGVALGAVSLLCGPFAGFCEVGAGGITAARYADLQGQASSLASLLATVQDYANRAGPGSYVEFHQDEPGGRLTVSVYDASGKQVYSSQFYPEGFSNASSDELFGYLQDAGNRTRNLLNPADKHNVSESPN